MYAAVHHGKLAQPKLARGKVVSIINVFKQYDSARTYGMQKSNSLCTA